MNVSIRHNGATITSRVIAYTREHQICSGIGQLQITLAGTYSTSVDPHDTIDIYENGDFKVRYYVSSVSQNVPDGTIILECQDRSKYLVDYFIPDSYTIDYPSYTRYWIEKFLTEAQVPYEFVTSSQGNLLSNNTALGLQPAYDQIMMLLQLSGWYMYFDGNGKAIIGSLDTDLATTAGSVGLDDIIDIKRITNDKMLRNRALVWGQFDGLRNEYAYADVTRHTRWDYDHNDLRTMVIANSNIPNKTSAYNIANILLKEFARATIEKHLTLTGARDYTLGKALRVNSHVWRGKGLITTFGVSMDRNGLVTNVVLDERCPRLFGFFNFGDYVYVGTFGDGVWRKHIKFDPAFYNFSTGLTDLHITDLHINNGIFGAVAESGTGFYANNEEGPWYPITMSSFVSSQDDMIPSGGTVNYVPFSGLMARAIVVDKSLDTVKFGIDNWSGVLNTGDYFLSYSGYTTSSGVVASGVTTSGYRSWIAEYDPYTGQLVGGLGSGIYPVSYSGDYNFFVVDLENDGINDYISVGGGSASGVYIPDGYDLGNYNTTTVNNTFDQDSVVASPIPTIADPLRTASYSPEIKNDSACAFFDDALTGNRHMIHIKFNGDIVKRSYSYSGGSLSSTTTTHAFIASTEYPLAIHKLEFEVEKYRVYYRKNSWDGNIYYKEWDVPSNTVSGATTVFTDTDVNRTLFSWNVSLNGKLYVLYYALNTPSMSGGQNTHQQDLRVYVTTINLESGLVLSANMIYSYSTTLRSGSATQYEYFPPGSHFVAIPTFKNEFMKFGLFQDGETRVKVLGWFEHGYFGFDWTEHLLVGDETSVTDTILKNSGTFRFVALTNSGTSTDGTQLSRSYGMLSYTASGSNQAFATNGSTFFVFTGAAPYYVDIDTVYPMYSRSQPYYIALNGSTFVACDAATLSPIINIGTSPDYTYRHPWSMPTTYGDEVFWYGWLNATGDEYLIKTPSILSASSITTFKLDFNGSTTDRGFNTGGWFIHGLSTSFTTPVTYYYFQGGELQFPNYLILQREGSEFNLIQQAAKPLRIDISNNSPILSVQDLENTFQSNFVYGNELTQIIPVSGLGTSEVRDYRYALLETLSGVVVASGAGVGMQAIYVTGSGIFTADLNTYSGGFTLYQEIPSGYAERIETSNYTYPGQYIFVTTSGENPMFYQKDNDGLVFDSYSGLPSSRATIIRLDDRF